MRVCEISGLNRSFSAVKPQVVKLNPSNALSEYLNPSFSFVSFYGKDLVKDKKTYPNVDRSFFMLPAGCTPDDYQLDAADSLQAGNSVLVTAPTGTGKTAIAEYVMTKNLKKGKKTFYATPLKALSNQKLNEFRAVYGDKNVGLLTGDRKINPNAPILIMTTEVYRNICLANYFEGENKLLNNLETIVFDEFHFLGDEDRGPVWEESIMFTPPGVQTLALSATVGQPERVQAWISKFQEKPVSLVYVPSEQRHVPLEYSYFQTDSYLQEEQQVKKAGKKGGKEDEQHVPARIYHRDYTDMIHKLKEQDQLPAIFFVFNKAYSADLIDSFGDSGVDLTTAKEKSEIESILDKYYKENYMGESINEEALLKGYAMHNASLLPIQKQLIEELFQKKLVKVVVSTETLAAGINMPARTVVMTSCQKPTSQLDENGKTLKRTLTSNEFHQMSGRAGRRGIDDIGYVYVMCASKDNEAKFNKLIDSKSEPLTSKLNPDYAFLAGIYKYAPDEKRLGDILSRSYYAFSNSEQRAGERLTNLIDICTQKRELLLSTGFLRSADEDKSVTTSKGNLLSIIKGYDQLTLIESLEKKLYKGFSPAMLAMVMSGIANAEPVSDEAAEKNGFDAISYDAEGDINNLKSNINTELDEYLKRMMLKRSDFRDLGALKESVLSGQAADVDVSFLKRAIDEDQEIINALNKIKSNAKSYSYKKLAEKLQDNELVPLASLQQARTKIDMFKRKHKNETFEELIAAKQAIIEVKQGGRDQKLVADLEGQKAELEAIWYLDINMDAVIDEYRAFCEQNPYFDVERRLQENKAAHYKAVNAQDLLSMIDSAIAINDIPTTDFSEINGEIEKVNNCFNNVISIAEQFKEEKLLNGIIDPQLGYSKKAPKAIYQWMFLNQVNPVSRDNWHYMMTTPNETTEHISEGSFFRMVMQTIDLLSQVCDVANHALEIKTEKADIEYYEELKYNAQEAIKLLMQEPVQFN